MKLLEGFDSNYRYILVAARRARQLQGGARPLVETVARKPCKIAQQEIEAGKVKFVVGTPDKTEASKVSALLDQALGVVR
jgi:DNA-directed RNA polymerase subunit omega